MRALNFENSLKCPVNPGIFYDISGLFSGQLYFHISDLIADQLPQSLFVLR
tara:strand:- start:89603 stop:89755 length:153 start_codon:yes stop_codon:yes gene_type:complete